MFDTVSMRASQSTLESQTNQTNISVLNPAVPPNEPSGPRTRLNVAIAVFLGGLLGVLLATALEFVQRRVRSADDLAALGDLPLLGQVSSARAMIRPLRLSLSRGSA
jgi:polysaccharide biosynthesis transport protein